MEEKMQKLDPMGYTQQSNQVVEVQFPNGGKNYSYIGGEIGQNKDCGELVESYLVIDCPKFVPLKIARKGISDNKVDWYLRFTPFQSAFTKEERALVNLYLNNRGCDVAKELQMCERSVHRELNKIKEKIKRLEERRNEECQDRTL